VTVFMFRLIFLKSSDSFFDVKTHPEDHVTLLRLKTELIMSHDSFKCQNVIWRITCSFFSLNWYF